MHPSPTEVGYIFQSGYRTINQSYISLPPHLICSSPPHLNFRAIMTSLLTKSLAQKFYFFPTSRKSRSSLTFKLKCSRSLSFGELWPSVWLLDSEWAIFSQCRVVVTFAVSKKCTILTDFQEIVVACGEVKLTVCTLCYTSLENRYPIVLTRLGLGDFREVLSLWSSQRISTPPVSERFLLLLRKSSPKRIHYRSTYFVVNSDVLWWFPSVDN